MEFMGWILVCLGFLCILLEIFVYLSKTWNERRKGSDIKRDAAGLLTPEIVIALIGKLPWMVVLGFLLIYLGLPILGLDVPIKIRIP